MFRGVGVPVLQLSSECGVLPQHAPRIPAPQWPSECDQIVALILTPISILKYCFLKLILLEYTPLLACSVFVVRPKLLLFRRVNSRKQYFYIDIGVKICTTHRRILESASTNQGTNNGDLSLPWGLVFQFSQHTHWNKMGFPDQPMKTTQQDPAVGHRDVGGTPTDKETVLPRHSSRIAATIPYVDAEGS